MFKTDALEEIAHEAIGWRRDFHKHPELLFDLPRTADVVTEKLSMWGCDEVVTGFAKSGVVGVVKGRLGPGRTIAFRSDMDALPMAEQTYLPYASSVPDCMHACGHDGHMAMLLAAIKHLVVERDFAGTLVAIFQPAEEGGGGASVMVKEGILDRFGIEEVYAMHNLPGLAVGMFATRPGPIMASGDRYVVTIQGLGGHAAYPHLARDPVLAGAHILAALQSISSRYTNPLDPVVVSITYINGGRSNALNVIPSQVEFGGVLRTVNQQTRRDVEARFRDIVEDTAKVFQCEAQIDWRPGYPVTVNHSAKAALAARVARSVAGDAKVMANWPCSMGSEDFAYMLEKRPGAMVWIGNGDSAALHNPAYDFNDDAVIHGMRYWTELAAHRLKPSSARPRGRAREQSS